MTDEQLGQKFTYIEERLDAQERMISQLMFAHTEMWAGVEALIRLQVDSMDAEAQTRWKQNFEEAQRALWKAINEQQRDVVRDFVQSGGTVGDLADDGDDHKDDEQPGDPVD